MGVSVRFTDLVREMCTHLSWLKFDFDVVTNLNNSFHSYNFNVY